MMRVAVLNDLPVAGPNSSGPGSGAELTIGRFVHAGARLGHETDVLTADFTSEAALREYDLIVAKNIVTFSADQMRVIMNGKVPYVAWPSDYAFTNGRLFFGFQPSVKRLPKIALFREWFTRSKLNVFLSPLHRDAYFWAMPEIEHLGPSVHISPPPVDARFLEPRPDDIEVKPKTACTINGGLEFKSLYGCLDYAYAHPDVQFEFIGAIRENVDFPPNAKFIGRLPWPDLVRKLYETETYVEVPRTVQPYNQSMVQAFLACKNIVTNEMMGAASFDWFKKGDRQEARRVLVETLPTLWAALEKVAA